MKECFTHKNRPGFTSRNTKREENKISENLKNYSASVFKNLKDLQVLSLFVATRHPGSGIQYICSNNNLIANPDSISPPFQSPQTKKEYLLYFFAHKRYVRNGPTLFHLLYEPSSHHHRTKLLSLLN